MDVNAKKLGRLLRNALKEDVGAGDITTELTVSSDSRCHATLRAKQDGVLSGMKVFRSVFDIVEAKVSGWAGKSDGEEFASGEVLATFSSLTRATLTGERTALNFLQHLSGIATETAAYVFLVDGSAVRICDTRKTSPLLRDLEKAAVRDGGGWNHRHGLHDGILIKENHVQAAGGIGAALEKAQRGSHHLMNIEIEVRNLDECREAIDAGAGVIMLDNMSIEDISRAVKLGENGKVQFEASGNVNRSTAREIAATGVDIISVGAITHSAPAADLSLTIEIDG
jgi:nicotinate-nucleotide pyrophosphorylase (carboxylating)